MERGNRRLQYLITSAVSTTAISNGVTFSWATLIIPKFHNNETGFHLTENELSWMVAMSSLGIMTGSLVSRFTADRYGRRANLLGSVIPLGVGLAFKILAWDVWTICAGRFLCGCAAGIISSVQGFAVLLPNSLVITDYRVLGLPVGCLAMLALTTSSGGPWSPLTYQRTQDRILPREVSTIYLAEISDKDIRGRLVLSNRFMFSFGCLITLTIGPFVNYQTINYAMLSMPIVYFSACWFIPETPYFLLKEGRVEAAKKTLAMLTNFKDEKLEERLLQMGSDVKKEMSRSGTAKEFFTGKQYRKAIIIITGIKLTQLMSGLHVVQQYLGLIVQESKFDIKLSTALIIFGVVKFVVGVMSSQLVDKVGRRPLLIFSFFGASAMLAIVGLYFFMNTQQIANAYGFVPFVGLILAIVIAILGFDSVAYAMPSELFPINIKSVAISSVYIFGGLMNFLSVKSYQALKSLGGLSTVFWIYAISSFLGAIFSIIIVPETKCKSLRQIQIELQGDIYDENAAKFQPALNNSGKHDDGEESDPRIIEGKDEV